MQNRVQKSNQKRSGDDPKRIDKPVEIMGVVINSTHRQELLRKIRLQRKEMLHVATVNPEYVMQARAEANFAKVLSQCTTTADGWGVVWGIQILAGQSVERVSGTWLVTQILMQAHRKGEKVFLLGAEKGVAQRAANEMSIKYPGARIYWYEGATNVAVEKREEASMTNAKINAVSPDYLLVAYGSPLQDIWIEENRPYLRARVALGVGGVLDEWAGEVAVNPAWIDQLGLKWLWRLVHEPKRIFRVLRVFQFAGLVLYHKIVD